MSALYEWETCVTDFGTPVCTFLFLSRDRAWKCYDLIWMIPGTMA